MSDLYTALKAAECPLDNHESDLYVLDSPEAREIILKHQDIELSDHTFISQIDGKVWIDLPFMYSPWWKARAR